MLGVFAYADYKCHPHKTSAFLLKLSWYLRQHTDLRVRDKVNILHGHNKSLFSTILRKLKTEWENITIIAAVVMLFPYMTFGFTKY